MNTSEQDVNSLTYPASSLKTLWWNIMDNWRVGIIPLPLFVLAGILIAVDCLNDSLPNNIVVMVATLAFFGFACGEFGKRLPIVGKMGAAAICATFIPSAMVYYGVLPQTVVTSTTQFFKSSNILYLYICCIIVGSIMSMNRSTLIQGFMRIFFPMLCCEIAGMLVGMGVGYALGLAPFQTFFFLILPIMAGGSAKAPSRSLWAMRPYCICNRVSPWGVSCRSSCWAA